MSLKLQLKEYEKDKKNNPRMEKIMKENNEYKEQLIDKGKQVHNLIETIARI